MSREGWAGGRESLTSPHLPGRGHLGPRPQAETLATSWPLSGLEEGQADRETLATFCCHPGPGIWHWAPKLTLHC